MYWLPYSSHTSHHPSDSLPSLNLLCHSKTDARFIQDGRKAVWSISVAFFSRLKQNFIAYRSSKVSWRPYCIFEIHQLWQSGFCSVYSNSCCSCSFEAEIIKIGQSSYKMYSNNIVHFQESMTILNACTKRFYWRHLVYIYIYIYIILRCLKLIDYAINIQVCVFNNACRRGVEHANCIHCRDLTLADQRGFLKLN